MVEPLIKNDAVVFGILMGILSFVIVTSNSNQPHWKKFYKYFPALLLCYFIPSVFNSLGIISGKDSNLYFVASRYLLPASLVLLTISVDLPAIKRLGSKAVIMFFTGTVGIVLGGPLSILLASMIAPDLVGGQGPEAVWRGFATVAGSWIGGGANQAAMKEIFDVGDSLFSAMIAIDVIVANIWMALLLYGTGIDDKINKWFDADVSSIDDLKLRMEQYKEQIMRIPETNDTMRVLAIGFGITGIAHLGADTIAPAIKNAAPELARFSLTSGFFWLIVISTTFAILLSFTKLRELEGVGASRIGSIFIYILVATIGMKMDILSIFDNPSLFIIGLIWMTIHAILLIIVAKIIKAPFFFLAVGSKANVGGAASAPILASAFHPSLAPVGVLLAVMGYAIGTYGAWLCGILMQVVSP
jgi:uncharacterized membrane protein|tara:strand:+ start:469 stop:1713 length:1245 start_codon:yes stop_codon:yes gene_type:complete